LIRFESTLRELCYTVLNIFDSWASVIQDIYDEEIDTDLLDESRCYNRLRSCDGPGNSKCDHYLEHKCHVPIIPR
jgi:hypothetical protein